MVEELRKEDVGCATVELREDGIMHVHIKETDTFEMDNSTEVFKVRERIADGKRSPIIYTCTQFVIPSKEVREFVASEERSELVLADAFVVNSLPQKLMANLFIKINKPVRPTKVFNNFEAACDWAKTFIPES